MDWFYLIIFGIALVVFFLDRMHSKPELKEKFFSDTEFPPKKLGVDYSAPSPDPSASMGQTNIKMPGIPKWKSRFSRFGSIPPNARCNITVLGEGCNNLPYPEAPGINQQICQKSYNLYPVDNPFGPYGSQKNIPIYVQGKSLSRVNQCNNLYDPTGQ